MSTVSLFLSCLYSFANSKSADPLAFKPNPADLMNQEMSEEEEDEDHEEGRDEGRDGIYRPPKLAPMPYTEPTKGKDKKRAGPTPTALSSLARLDPSMPHLESTSGLGSTPALMSKRAQELQRMTEFEEENFTRLVMKKKDARKRKADEANMALGGIGETGRHGRGGGLEDEFGDILRFVGRSRTGVVGDGYEELRQKGKKASVLARSRTRARDDILDAAAPGGSPLPVMTFSMKVDESGDITDYKIRAGLVRNVHKMAYDDIDLQLNAPKFDPLVYPFHKPPPPPKPTSIPLRRRQVIFVHPA